MKVWIYVEGESDKNALATLWEGWCEQLRLAGHGIKIIPLNNKSQFFRKIGHRAAEKLCGSDEDVVVSLPDLYPNQGYDGTEFEHSDMAELQQVQRREVSRALKETFNLNGTHIRSLLERFRPTALKHDVEMLLLATKNELRSYLGTSEHLGGWRNPVEEQNQNRPPKRVVEELFRTKSVRRQAYRATKDASAILRKVTNIRTIIYNNRGQVQCPVFKAMLDWIGCRTGVAAYS